MTLDKSYPGNASWIEINAQNLLDNMLQFRNLQKTSPQTKFGTVLKGNAYGHGLLEVLSVVHGKTDVIYVITPQDAFKIRKYESEKQLAPKQIVVLGAIVPCEAVELARLEIDAVLADSEAKKFVEALRVSGVKSTLKCHIHIDTGLGREGFPVADISKHLAFLNEAKDVCYVKGVLSHFANTEDVTEQEYALRQLSVFEEGISILKKTLKTDQEFERHIAASAGTMSLPQARYDVMRVGISLYGLWPSPETRLSAKIVLDELPKLTPVLSWRCKSQVVKWLAKGSYIGYGCTFRCVHETRVAVLPVGYYDGYPRLLSSKAHVLVNGQRCPVLGRVMMNHIVIDVTEAVHTEEPIVATLIGNEGTETIVAETVAAWAQSINYEIITRIGPHLKRCVV